MKSTLTMQTRVDAYLKARRRLGFQLKIEGSELVRFAKYADQSGHQGPVTTELALSWAQLAKSATDLYRARRLETVRTFAKHQVALEPQTEIPPVGILGPAHRRTAPYIFSDEEIAQLIKAAEMLRSPKGLRAITYSSLIGLLASTGLRISEALCLHCTDVDLESEVICIRETKFRKTRLVPLHPSVTRALRSYVDVRETVVPGAKIFFSNETGDPLPYSTVRTVFRKLADRIIHVTSARRKPRLHDLRHTYACSSLLRWYRAGVDVNQRIAALSTYLGHAKVSDTYWYLTGVPELMTIAGGRFEHFARGRES
jgi:integrase